jgi:hypothetical protein
MTDGVQDTKVCNAGLMMHVRATARAQASRDRVDWERRLSEADESP